MSGAEPNSHPSRYRGIEQRLRASRPRATVYFHLVRQPAKGRVAIEYWFHYLYNDFYDRHEADWEGVTVFLQDNKPLGVSYSAHQGRRWSRWAAQSTQNGTHPIVYVAYGWHADYPSEVGTASGSAGTTVGIAPSRRRRTSRPAPEQSWPRPATTSSSSAARPTPATGDPGTTSSASAEPRTMSLTRAAGRNTRARSPSCPADSRQRVTLVVGSSPWCAGCAR